VAQVPRTQTSVAFGQVTPRHGSCSQVPFCGLHASPVGHGWPMHGSFTQVPLCWLHTKFTGHGPLHGSVTHAPSSHT
jgi:hypothetical protein